MKFVHLHTHTEYSLIDGMVRIDPLIEQAYQDRMPAVAITDQVNLFAMVKFYKAARAKGIKPIIGAEVWIHNEQDLDKPYSLVLLCQNKEGYKNLSILISKAYQLGQYHDKAIIKREWFNGLSSGLIALSGATKGNIGYALLANDKQQALVYLKDWLQLFPGNFYLELQRTGKPNEEEYIQAALDLAEQENISVVATNDVRFLATKDFEAHEARVCIHKGSILSDPKRLREYTEEQYFKSADGMLALFADVPSALSNTVEIAKRCNVVLTLDKNFLPNFPVPAGQKVEDYLAISAVEGLKVRLQQKREPLTSAQQKIYAERLQAELQVINKMGFAGYFLIVADFIQWAKDNGVPVGPGRGSGAGSLVAFAIKITDLDPLQFDLLFERFLNPERVSMPDFDIDFCMEGRDRVIDYVTEKYGRESVSQIITFGTMAAKAVVRDVGRVLDYPYGFVDKIAKLIPFELGITLEKALTDPLLKERYENEEEVRTLIDLAMDLEGIARNAGKHAGGVVIAPGKLTDFAPLYCEQGTEHYVTQFDKDDIEAIGLVKFDFLGLRTLTIIDWAVQTINQKLSNQKININHISLDDEACFRLLKTCQTTAVFQLESRGMKDLVKRLQPDCFEDIIALVALFRPGPLQSGMVDDFINRKHGEAAIIYPHPLLEPILKPTYGIIVYQEQVMQIAQVLAGYSLGAADILRRAMGKKKPEEMAKQRQIFIEGAVKNKVEGKTAAAIFDLMEKFAGYGFNKSHSATYALIAYQTAWLKVQYPAEFMAAVLSSDMDNTDKVVIFIEECRVMKLEILPPRINQGQFKFTVNEEGKIIYGLGAIKGVGEAALSIIIEERNKNGLFRNLLYFCSRIDSRKVTKRVLEALIKSGAMDELGPDRSILYESLASIQQVAEQLQHNQARNQTDLFSMTASDQEVTTLAPVYVTTAQWSAKKRLQFEKETLGFYLTGHPFEEYIEEITQFVSVKLNDLYHHLNNTVIIAGLVTQIRKLKTKRGKIIVIVTIDDCTAKTEITFFSEIYEQVQRKLVIDNLVVLEGEAAYDDYSGGVRINAKRLWTLEEARYQFAKRLVIEVNPIHAEKGLIKELAAVLSAYRGGNCPVQVYYKHDQGIALLPLGQAWRVAPKEDLLLSLRKLLSETAVRVDYGLTQIESLESR